jgi:hypothetical protein
MITGEESTAAVISFILSTQEKAKKMGFWWRYQVWAMTSYISVICLVLTYAAQFVTS